MSLLGTQVYANTTTPLWFSADGGTINGDVTITGSVDVSGNIQSSGDVQTATSFQVTDPAFSTGWMRITSTASNSYVQGASNIKFGQIGQSTTNTTLTLSAPGSGLDNFTTNFLNAIGPVPTNIITSSKTINPVPTSPATAFGVDVPYPTISNAVYDVQATGIITLASGASDPDDAILLALDAGTGTSITTYTFYPEGPGQSGNFSIRQRIVANAVQPSLAVLANKTLAGASTAVYAATLNYFSVVRVA